MALKRFHANFVKQCAYEFKSYHSEHVKLRVHNHKQRVNSLTAAQIRTFIFWLLQAGRWLRFVIKAPTLAPGILMMSLMFFGEVHLILATFAFLQIAPCLSWLVYTKQSCTKRLGIPAEACPHLNIPRRRLQARSQVQVVNLKGCP